MKTGYLEKGVSDVQRGTPHKLAMWLVNFNNYSLLMEAMQIRKIITRG